MKKYSLALLVSVFVFSFFTHNINNASAIDALVPECNPGEPCDPPVPPPSTTPPNLYKFAIGDNVATITSVNMRSYPSLSAPTIRVISTGIKGRVISGPIQSEGYTWWNVVYNDGSTGGWSADAYLVKDVESPGRVPPTSTSTNSSQFALGDNIITTTAVNLRSGPSTGAVFIRTVPEGTKGKIVTGPGNGSGYTWWYIIYSDSIIGGWSAQDFIKKDTSTLFSVGDSIITKTTVSARVAPTLSSDQIAVIPFGTKGKITQGPTIAEDFTWWNVTYSNGIIGWSIDSLFDKDSSVPPPTTPPTSNPPTTNPPVTNSPSSAPTLTITASPSSITAGQSTTLTLVSNATHGCVFNPTTWSNNGRIDSQGILTINSIVSPTETSTYSATCYSLASQTTKSVTVTVTQPITVTPPVTPPSAPTAAPTLSGSAGECGTGRVNLSWTSVPNATAYQIFRGGFSTGVWQTVTGTSYSYVDPVIPEGWRYDVRAINSIGNGPLSNPTTGVGVSTAMCSTTSTPTVVLKVNDGTAPITVAPHTSVKISWSSSGSVDGCHLNNTNDQTNTANVIPASGTWYTPGVVVDTNLIINCSNQIKSNAISIKVVSAVATTFPYGCSSSTGWSSATGLLCSGAVLGASTSLPSGCNLGANYSVTTGMSCYAPGCSSYHGYSVTTGKSCSI